MKLKFQCDWIVYCSFTVDKFSVCVEHVMRFKIQIHNCSLKQRKENKHICKIFFTIKDRSKQQRSDLPV